MEQKILKNTTHSILGYPRVAASGAWLRAIPSLATVRIATQSTPMPAVGAGDAATVDAVNTTLSSAAAEGDTVLNITSAAIKRGRRYLVADGDGGFIDVESRTEGTSTTMRLAEPLPRAIANGLAVKGYALSHALTAGETTIDGPALALWRATVDGEVYEWDQPFRITARMPVCLMTPSRLTKAWPSIRTLRTRQDDTFEELIESTWEYDVYPLLAKNSIDDEDVVSWDVLDPLMAIGCLHRCALDNPKVGPEQFKKIEDAWFLEQKEFFSSKHWEVQEQVDAPSPGASKPSGPARSNRLVR